MSGRPHAARYIVGIDLGTSNTAVGFADTRGTSSLGFATTADGVAALGGERPRIGVFEIPQLVAAGEVERRPLLPSFRYHLAPDELSDADRSLGFAEPLPELPPALVGVLAQQFGSRVPGRLVASAKSWLCHAGVHRRAAVLPWGAPEGVRKVSPVEASASYLAHVRAAWDAAHPAEPLSEQEVVLTVPASFDEVARTLTLEAAKLAGLPTLRLLEEPQAALYDFIDRRRETLETELAAVRLVLVLDVGGGTTDLSLVRVELRESGLRLTRIAVGDHLMLGGDNMDHALARLCEPVLAGVDGAHLPAARFAQLIQACRQAKERLLGPQAPEQLNVTLLGTGSSVVAGNVSMPLLRTAAEHAVIDGFFPQVERDAQPGTRRSGLVEFGLPFAADPVITRHVAAFLSRHRAVVAEALGLTAEEVAEDPRRLLPDAVLLNGGVFRSPQLQARMLEVLGGFREAPLRALDNPEPELAVARGAVAYGLARRGMGLRIGGGSARSYYLVVQADEAENAVCILPRGAEEGEPYALTGRRFALRIGEPVRFRLLTSTSEQTHRPGELVSADERYQALPEIAAVIDARSAAGDRARSAAADQARSAAGDRAGSTPPRSEELHVELEAQLTEVGTLEMSLVSSAERTRRYQLEFQLRADAGADDSRTHAHVTQLHPRFAAAGALVQSYYGKAQKELAGRKILTLRNDMEKLIGPREQWDTPLLRELFGQFMAGSKRRRRSADHERLFFHFAGYCLRPGFGYPIDGWRIEQLWPIFQESVQFVQDAQVWSQFWILWRRIAGGLDDAQHTQIFAALAPHLQPQGARPRPKPKGPRPQGLEDMARLAASLERVPAASKAELGEWLMARLAKGELSAPSVHWSLGRIGARAPWYGSAHSVVSADIASSWLERLLALDLRKSEQAPFAVGQLARLTQDRARDLAPALRERAAQALTQVAGTEPWVKLIREGGALSASEESRVFGESLPPGLRLL
jgi:molecular chaperone DnaK (HSP70)